MFLVSSGVSIKQHMRNGKRGEMENGNVGEEEWHQAANLKFLKNEVLQ